MANKPKLYRLRFTANCSSDQAYFQKGEEHSFPKDRAQLFVKAGVAVEAGKETGKAEEAVPASTPSPKKAPPKKRAWSKPKASKTSTAPTTGD